MRDRLLAGRWFLTHHLHARYLNRKGDPVLKKIKTWLTSNPEGKRVVHYAETFALVFLTAAIATWQKLPPHSYTWAAVSAVAVAGGKAVLDVVVPLLLGKLTSDTTKG